MVEEGGVGVMGVEVGRLDVLMEGGGSAMIGEVVPGEVLLGGVLLVAGAGSALASAVMLYDGYEVIVMELMRMR